MTVRTVTETVVVNPEEVVITVATSDGLRFPHTARITSGSPVKSLDTAIATARRNAAARRIWLNQRRGLTLDELKQLVANEQPSQ